jgi:hypothetical protein
MWVSKRLKVLNHIEALTEIDTAKEAEKKSDKLVAEVPARGPYVDTMQIRKNISGPNTCGLYRGVSKNQI